MKKVDKLLRNKIIKVNSYELLTSLYFVRKYINRGQRKGKTGMSSLFTNNLDVVAS